MSNLVPIESEFKILKDICVHGVNSGFLPGHIKTNAQALVIALKGREMGIPPMMAFSKMHVINGKVGIDAELMRAQVYSKIPGAVLDFVETSDKICTVEVKRQGGRATRFSFSIEDAQRAGLLSKEGWKKYPADMLRARASSAAIRAVFPDALMGASYTPEELGADVNDSGEITRDVTETDQKEKKTEKPREEKKTVETLDQESPPQNESGEAMQTCGDFVIKFGSADVLGKKLSDLGHAKVSEMLAWFKKSASPSFRSSPLGLEFKFWAETFLKRKGEEEDLDAALADPPDNSWQNDDFDKVEKK